ELPPAVGEEVWKASASRRTAGMTEAPWPGRTVRQVVRGKGWAGSARDQNMTRAPESCDPGARISPLSCALRPGWAPEVVRRRTPGDRLRSELHGAPVSGLRQGPPRGARPGTNVHPPGGPPGRRHCP